MSEPAADRMLWSVARSPVPVRARNLRLSFSKILTTPPHVPIMALPKADQTRWFSEEVQPHEPSLRAYLRGSFPSVADVDDVVQESYLRVWKAWATQPIRSARAFLFRVARHHALDLVRRERISPVSGVRDLAALTVVEDGCGVAEAVSRQEKVRLLAEAIDALPAGCRQVVVLRKLKCLSQKEVSLHLGLAEKTIEAQLARGVKRCEDFLRKRGVHGFYFDDAS